MIYITEENVGEKKTKFYIRFDRIYLKFAKISHVNTLFLTFFTFCCYSTFKKYHQDGVEPQRIRYNIKVVKITQY